MNEWSYVRMRFGSAVNVTGSNKFFAVSEMEIYATEMTAEYNKIYYKDALYSTMEPELPAATASDSGKVLSVDASGDYQLSSPISAVSDLTDVNLTNLADGP